jgi:anti-anti-sigma factor
MCSCELDTETGPAGAILVLRVAGEIDMATLPVVQSALTAATDQRPGDLVVDLAAVSFCCVRGFALLATAARTAQADGISYALSGLPAHLDRVATLLWPEQPWIRYRSAAAAVTAIRIDHTYRHR